VYQKVFLKVSIFSQGDLYMFVWMNTIPIVLYYCLGTGVRAYVLYKNLTSLNALDYCTIFIFFICIFSTQKILTHVFEGGKNQLNYIVQFLSVKFIIYISKFWIYPKKTFWMSAIFKYVIPWKKHILLFFVYFTITYLKWCSNIMHLNWLNFNITVTYFKRNTEDLLCIPIIMFYITNYTTCTDFLLIGKIKPF
jgi:hypothetical protein